MSVHCVHAQVFFLLFPKNPSDLSPSRHGNVFNRDLQATARKHSLEERHQDMSDPTVTCQKLRVLTHPPPGKKKRAHVHSDPGELDPLILHHMPRQECMIHAEWTGQLKRYEKNTRDQTVSLSQDVTPWFSHVGSEYGTHFEDNKSRGKRTDPEHTKVPSKDSPSTADFKRTDLKVTVDLDSPPMLLSRSSELAQKTVVNQENNRHLENPPSEENTVPARLPSSSLPARDISPPSTPRPTDTHKSPSRSPIPHHLATQLRDSGPCWTAASWKKLSGGLANEGYNSCYLNSLIQVVRQNDGFHNLLVELSQFTGAQKYVSNSRMKNNNGSGGKLGSNTSREKIEDNIFEFLYTATLDLWDAETGPLSDGDGEKNLPVDAEVGRHNQRSRALHLVDLLEAVG